MALKSGNLKELPEGVVRVSEEEALRYQKSLVTFWPSQSDVLFLKYGHVIASVSTVISSFLITNHFRRFFHSDFKIFGLTFVPGFGLPLYCTLSFTERIVTNDVLLMKDRCPMCLYMKFGLLQFYSSFLFPSLYSFSSYAMYANLKGTFVIPPVKDTPSEFWKYTFKAFKSGAKSFQIIGLLQTILVFYLPYKQHKELFYISNNVRGETDTELLVD